MKKKLFFIILIVLIIGLVLDAVSTVIALNIPQVYPLYEVSPFIYTFGLFGIVLASILFTLIILVLCLLYMNVSKNSFSKITLLFIIFNVILIKYYATLNNFIVILLQLGYIPLVSFRYILTYSLLTFVLIVPIFIVEEVTRYHIHRVRIRKAKIRRLKKKSKFNF